MNAARGRKRLLQNAPDDRTTAVAALYVHVPFCAARCRYCDFCSTAYESQLAEQVIDAELVELARRAERLTQPADSIFVGGGTPTILPPPLLTRLMQALGAFAGPSTEFSLEANPNSLSEESLSIVRRAGVNRLSIGVQSFQDAELAVLGRLHSADEARRALLRAAQAGLTSLSADLIYGIPGQSLEGWQNSLRQLLDLPIDHVSCYCLSLEPGTPLAEDVEAGRETPMDESLQRECYELAIDLLAEAGLEHYEISNFARPGHRCRHNLVYWHNRPYLGVGPSAVSYLDGRRTGNTHDLQAYVEDIQVGRAPTAMTEQLFGRALMAETLMLMLRLRDGVDRQAFRARFGEDPAEAFDAPVRRYLQLGMLDLTSDRLALTRPALFVADTILADIVADSSP